MTVAISIRRTIFSPEPRIGETLENKCNVALAHPSPRSRMDLLIDIALHCIQSEELITGLECLRDAHDACLFFPSIRRKIRRIYSGLSSLPEEFLQNLSSHERAQLIPEPYVLDIEDGRRIYALNVVAAEECLRKALEYAPPTKSSWRILPNLLEVEDHLQDREDWMFKRNQAAELLARDIKIRHAYNWNLLGILCTPQAELLPVKLVKEFAHLLPPFATLKNACDVIDSVILPEHFAHLRRILEQRSLAFVKRSEAYTAYTTKVLNKCSLFRCEDPAEPTQQKLLAKAALYTQGWLLNLFDLWPAVMRIVKLWVHEKIGHREQPTQKEFDIFKHKVDQLGVFLRPTIPDPLLNRTTCRAITGIVQEIWRSVDMWSAYVSPLGPPALLSVLGAAEEEESFLSWDPEFLSSDDEIF